MSIHYQYTLLVISLLCFLCILWLLRKSLLHPVHAAWWMGIALLVLLAGIFPGAFDYLGHHLGVTYPPTLFLFCAIIVLLIRMLMADLERCRMLVRLRMLNQHQARLGLRILQLERKISAASENDDSAVPLAAKGDAECGDTPQ